MPSKRPSIARSLAAGIAIFGLLAALPQAALAADDGLWARWADEVTDRENVWEIPLAVIFSLPAMLVSTPFYWGNLALDALGDDD